MNVRTQVIQVRLGPSTHCPIYKTVVPMKIHLLHNGVSYPSVLPFSFCVVVLGRMVEHSNIRSLSNFQQMFCFTKPSKLWQLQ